MPLDIDSEHVTIDSRWYAILSVVCGATYPTSRATPIGTDSRSGTYTELALSRSPPTVASLVRFSSSPLGTSLQVSVVLQLLCCLTNVLVKDLRSVSSARSHLVSR